MSQCEEMSNLYEKKMAGLGGHSAFHDAVLKVAQTHLEERFPGRAWDDSSDSHPGIDIVGTLDGQVDVACEVKSHDFFMGNHRESLLRDLEALVESSASAKIFAVGHKTLVDGLLKSKIAGSLLDGVEVLIVPELCSEWSWSMAA